MVADQKPKNDPSIGITQPVFFNGDSVRLAGQTDYANVDPPSGGYPLIFVIQHATSTSRAEYQHLVRIGASLGMAVFRWDKRGTGASGSGFSGSAVGDTLAAYKEAVSQKYINPNRVIIAAYNEGSLLLHDALDQFNAIQKPYGLVLIGNMLDEKAITALQLPVYIVMSKNDWNDWQTYGRDAAEAHALKTGYDTQHYVAPNTNRQVLYANGGTFHRGAEKAITDWLDMICPDSP
ncbi:hypothetical protein G4Y79_21860 [Phototrophicus methaneseepsis]|uniref:Serine aminopeptidase S33 domain-containing protein n=1 Tax=Phototrophicus methaneseepsis TaxID=2710758 RepID=A0A7S8E8F5_9CHLR|nr:hypothetical protein [Phototrophicus methaneseepsis]QPC82299.1 hypothetical protein G4Y79_21860 [Phototrophicus methaneseepsis]